VRIFFIFDFSSVRYSKFNQALLYPSIEMVKVAENASKARVNLTEFQKSEYSRSPHFLLLGYPVSQSLSPLMHNTASEHYGMDARYFPIALESNEFTLLASHFNNPLFKGANVTIPYKLMLRDYVDDMDESARAAGAVNTIVKRSAKVLGYNTDSYGFAVPLVEFQDELEDSTAVVFGTGGASRAVIRALRRMHVSTITLISRNPSQITSFEEEADIRIESYESWTAFADEAAIIVNSTPLGMEPDVESSPVRDDEKDYLSDKICYDIVYKPVETRFLALARDAGARTIPGLEMLIYQGSKSFELWTGKAFPIDKVRNRLHEAIENEP